MFNKKTTKQDIRNDDDLANICSCFTSFSLDKKLTSFHQIQLNTDQISHLNPILNKKNVKKSITSQLKKLNSPPIHQENTNHNKIIKQHIKSLPQSLPVKQVSTSKIIHYMKERPRLITENLVNLNFQAKVPPRLQQFYEEKTQIKNSKKVFFNNSEQKERKIIFLQPQIPKSEIKSMKKTVETETDKKNMTESLGMKTKLVQSQVFQNEEQSDNYSIVLEKIDSKNNSINYH